MFLLRNNKVPKRIYKQKIDLPLFDSILVETVVVIVKGSSVDDDAADGDEGGDAEDEDDDDGEAKSIVVVADIAAGVVVSYGVIELALFNVVVSIALASTSISGLSILWMMMLLLSPELAVLM